MDGLTRRDSATPPRRNAHRSQTVALVEGEGADVVVRGAQPEPPAPLLPRVVDAPGEQGPAHASTLDLGGDRDDLVVVAADRDQRQPDVRTVEPGDEAGQAGDVHGLAAPGHHEGAPRLGHEVADQRAVRAADSPDDRVAAHPTRMAQGTAGCAAATGGTGA